VPWRDRDTVTYSWLDVLLSPGEVSPHPNEMPDTLRRLSEVLGSSAALPEAQTVRKGGSTFDTLNGNVLAR
jgi:hypothetical protein